MILKLSDELKEELYETFTALDFDGNGLLSTDEIMEMLGLLNIFITREHVQNCIHRYDEDGNGYMDFNEFCTFMINTTPVRKEKELRKIFSVVDTNGNGFIDREELRRLLVDIGRMRLSEIDIDDIFEVIHQSGEGNISFLEFSSFFWDYL